MREMWVGGFLFLIAFTQYSPDLVVRMGEARLPKHPKFKYLDLITTENIKSSVFISAATNQYDFCNLIPHWGDRFQNYKTIPHQKLKNIYLQQCRNVCHNINKMREQKFYSSRFGLCIKKSS